jgi:hypothetical protein
VGNLQSYGPTNSYKWNKITPITKVIFIAVLGHNCMVSRSDNDLQMVAFPHHLGLPEDFGRYTGV